MLALFLALFSAAILFISMFLINLPGDIKKQSLRPLFLLLFAIGFWITTIIALVTPEYTSSQIQPSYNVITSAGWTLYPAYTTNTVQVLSSRVYYSYFNVWLSVFFFLFFMLLLWFLLLLREKTGEVLAKGRDVMEETDIRLSK